MALSAGPGIFKYACEAFVQSPTGPPHSGSKSRGAALCHGRNAGFYAQASGKTVRVSSIDPEGLFAIKLSLSASFSRDPPAWTDVWICPLANGHLQATGRDARGRKQHRYHPRWREVRDDTKYARTMAFAKALPKIRARVAKDLKRAGLQREKVLATVVKLLEVSLIRVGNEEYANGNGSYGLTTMQDRHAKVNGSRVQFRFSGKSGKAHTIDVKSPHLAKIVKQCQDLPGQDLFQYIDGEGKKAGREV
jgi:DNA topoisomerase-1